MLALAAIGLGGGAAPAAGAVFTVTNTADSGAGSLRQAITEANAASGADEIHFKVPGAGVETIRVTSGPLPTVTGRLRIDGATEPGFAGTPLIRIDNATGSAFADGLDITAGRSHVLSLSITGFATAVSLRTKGSNVVAGNRLGVTPSGAVDGNIVGVGMRAGSTGNAIGGTAPAARNIISGNDEGVFIDGADGAVIRGNFIGVSPNGDAAMGNANAGIRITGGAKSVVVGGTAAGAGNVISGNRGAVNINGAGTSGNVVAGNLIGTTANGAAAIPNQLFGVGIDGAATGNTVGGTKVAARNLISGNANASGVAISGTGTTGNTVAGNFIGTTANGAAALPNARGVLLSGGATANTVGGDTSAARNLISGNTGPGVHVDSEGTDGNVVAGNRIGTNLAGTAAVPNATQGVLLIGGPSANTIGGTTSGARNVISGNGLAGVDVRLAGTTGNAVQGNLIGTTADGASALPNQSSGVTIASGAEDNTIGGVRATARNVISGNKGSGVVLDATGPNVVSSNYIGLRSNGDDPLGNSGYGVQLTGTTGVRIGGTTSGARNVIAGNTLGGIRVAQGSTRATIQGNHIGTNARGENPIANAGDGIAFDPGTSDSTVGGTLSGSGNVIAFNGGDGVSVDGSDAPTTGIAIQRNSLFDNAQLGIRLVPNGNDNQPAPVITAVTASADGATITGTLSAATPRTTHRIEAFASPACDGLGAGEGKRFLGAKAVKTNAAGNGTWTMEVGPLDAGEKVTATATRSEGPKSTSELSGCVPE